MRKQRERQRRRNGVCGRRLGCDRTALPERPPNDLGAGAADRGSADRGPSGKCGALMKQPMLFDLPERPLEVRGPAEARPRLGQQAARILARLERGPVSNRELADISLKYTGRISDLRANGYHVECFKHDYKSGLAWYRLAPDVSL